MTKLSKLKVIVLTNNYQSGEISSWIGQLTSLTMLSLANNNFVFSIPKQRGGLFVLTYLDLLSNFLSSEISMELENLNLNHLNLSHNELYGNIPPFFTKSTYTMSFLDGNLTHS